MNTFPPFGLEVVVGVTGTRDGMTKQQHDTVRHFLTDTDVFSLRHGDCVGVDNQVAGLAAWLNITTISHPPTDTSLQAHHPSDIVLAPKTYFARNRDIVDSCDVLLVVPREDCHQPRGGTWYTHDYALKKGRKTIVIFPDGRIECLNFQ